MHKKANTAHEKRATARRASDKAMVNAAKMVLADTVVEDDLLTREEAAERLSVGISTVDRLTRHGRLKSVRIPSPSGGRPTVRYEPGEVDRFVAQHRC